MGLFTRELRKYIRKGLAFSLQETFVSGTCAKQKKVGGKNVIQTRKTFFTPYNYLELKENLQVNIQIADEKGWREK